MSVRVLALVQVLYDWDPPTAASSSSDGGYLTLRKGDVFPIVQKAENGWWEGHMDGRFGWCPSNFVSVLSAQQRKTVDPSTIRLSAEDATRLLGLLKKEESTTATTSPDTSAVSAKGRVPKAPREKKKFAVAFFRKRKEEGPSLMISEPRDTKHTAHLSQEQAVTEEAGILAAAPHLGITMTHAQRIVKKTPSIPAAIVEPVASLGPKRTEEEAMRLIHENWLIAMQEVEKEVEAEKQLLLERANSTDDSDSYTIPAPAAGQDLEQKGAAVAATTTTAAATTTTTTTFTSNTESRYRLALYEHIPDGEDEIALVCGEAILVLAQHDSGWWMGQTLSGMGLFPVNRTRAATLQEVPEELAALLDNLDQIVLRSCFEEGTSVDPECDSGDSASIGEDVISILSELSMKTDSLRLKNPEGAPPVPPPSGSLFV